MRIDETLRESAARNGLHPAVVCSRSRHSYAELDLKSERLAAALRSGGVAPGDRAMMFMDDGWEAVVSLFAVLKAGGVVAPIDAAAPTSALVEALDACQPTAVITQSRLAAAVAAAIAPLRSVKVVVLAGGDRARTGGTCISFEDAVGRIARIPPLAVTDTDAAAAVVVDGRVPVSHRELLDEASQGVPADESIALAPLAERSGLARLLAAIAAGRTLVARSRFPREEAAVQSLAASSKVEARFDLSDVIQSMAGGVPAFQR